MSSPVPILAALLSPALFYGGTAVVAAPILIHLLARRRFRRIRWAAMEFLIDAERRNRRRIRMEEWILLALRCLAVLLVALMIARPFIKPTSAAAFLGKSQRIERVFVLDDSFSMGYAGPGGTPFAQAKLAVRHLLESIRRETPDDTVTLVRMSAPTNPVESGTYLDDTQTEDLLVRLDGMTASQRSIDPVRVVEGVAEVLERSPDVTSAAIYFISDFQRHNWIGPPSAVRRPSSTAAATRSGLLDPLTAWSTGDRGLHVVLINVGVDDVDNLAVTALGLGGGQLIAGAAGTVRATVANFGRRPVENIELQVSVGNLLQPTQTLRELPAGQSAVVDLEAEFFRAGFEAVRVELPADPLPPDNVRYQAVDVAGAIRVLIVNGETSSDAFDDEVAFLKTALRPEGDVFSGNEPVVIDETQLDEINLSGFHVAILANVYRIGEPAVEVLERFVRRGGGLLVFLGDQVDADLYNGSLWRSGEGLLPGELTEIIRPPQPAHLVVTDRLHPAMRGVSRRGDPLGIGQIPFFQYFGCIPFEGQNREREGTGEGVAEDTPEPGRSGRGATETRGASADAGSADTDTTGLTGKPEEPIAQPGGAGTGEKRGGAFESAGRAARVIARFDDADEHPAIVERTFGRGHVILVTTSADKEWNQWPDHPTFLPVMMELVRHTARQSDTGSDIHVGDAIGLTLDPAAFELDALVRGPAYPNEPEVALTAVHDAGTRGLSLKWEHTEQPGLYQFILKRRDGGETVKLVAVNVDPAESDLTMAGEDELRHVMGNVPVEYHRGADSLSNGTGEAAAQLWRFVLIAAFAVLMLEQGLAFVWGRKR